MERADKRQRAELPAQRAELPAENTRPATLQTHLCVAPKTPRSDTEILLKSFDFERTSCFPREAADSPLDPFFVMHRSDVVAAVRKAEPLLVEIVMGVTEKEKVVHVSKDRLGPS